MKKLVSMDPSLVLVDECKSAPDAYSKIVSHEIDLLLLDIEMPGMSGIELVKSLGNKKPLIIFTTSQRDYAADAFDLNVVDFVTKPVTPARFLQSITKAKEIFHKTGMVKPGKEDEFIFIRDSNVVRRIKLADILYLEAMGDYVKIYLTTQTYSIHSTLKSVEDKLPSGTFIRVHRSFIINISKIDTIEGGTLVIHNNLVPVSDAYRSILNKRMQIL